MTVVEWKCEIRPVVEAAIVDVFMNAPQGMQWLQLLSATLTERVAEFLAKRDGES